MDFKKLNEELEKYVVNEISASLADKVKRKRIDQLNKLQQKVKKDTYKAQEKGQKQFSEVLTIVENWMKKKFKNIKKSQEESGFITSLYGFNPYTKYTHIGLAVWYHRDWFKENDNQTLNFQTCILNYYGDGNSSYSNTLRRVEGVVKNGTTSLSIPLNTTPEEIIKLLDKDFEDHKGLAEQFINIDNEILKTLQEDPDIEEETKNVGMEMHGAGCYFDQNQGYYKDVWFNTIFNADIDDYNEPLTYTIELYTGFQGRTIFNSVEDFKNNFKKILERTYKRRLKNKEKRAKEGKPERRKTVTNIDLSGPIIQPGTYYIGKE